MIFPNGTTEHPINKSGKKKILVSVWDFAATHPQSQRRHYLCNDHPAKMRPCLARAILQVYGESPVLDPMAGVGTTLVEAMRLGMDAVGVEYEKNFADQANKNIEHTRKLFPNQKLGTGICVQGDARDLSCLSSPDVNSIVLSPPYSEGIGHPAGRNAGNNYPWRLRLQRKMTEAWSEGSISKLRYGKSFGSILLSPPYFNAIESVSTGHQGPEGGHLGRQHRLAKQEKSGYGNKNNIGHVEKYGSIVFSPPYCGVMDAKRHVGGIAARDKALAKTASYSNDERNLGNLSRYGEFGTIVFSPPYIDTIRANKEGPLATSMPSGWKSKKVRISEGYSKDPSNIGNMRESGQGRTYFGEMFKVYEECLRVLKPGKFMVVVVKDIRRKGLTVPLGADTIKLLQLVGFNIFDVVINKMYFLSFWQLTHAQKSQSKGVPMSLRSYEYVIVAKKPAK